MVTDRIGALRQWGEAGELPPASQVVMESRNSASKAKDTKHKIGVERKRKVNTGHRWGNSLQRF